MAGEMQMLLSKIFNNKKGQIGYANVLIAIGLLTFWLCFPLAMKLLDSSSYNQLDDKTINAPAETTGIFSICFLKREI